MTPLILVADDEPAVRRVTEMPAITEFLTDLLGVKLVAHIVDKEPSTVRRWEKNAPSGSQLVQRSM